VNSVRRTTSWHTVVDTLLGGLTLVRDVNGLSGVYYPHHWYRPDPSTFGDRVDEGFDDVAAQLADYLAGARRDFDLALAPRGDELQHQVWDAIRQVGYGETATYGAIAAGIGRDVTAQQVGTAVGRNPLCILVPCHRIVGRDGKLTGYAGGIGRKRKLLDLERDHAARANGTPFQPSLIEIP
jgi:methylated-DNA-[protein]-cysteine S-methyltransferase